MKRCMIWFGAVGVALALMLAPRAPAATPAEIAASIDSGVAWLISHQNADGSWGAFEQVAQTALAVVKLEERAFELGYSSPFDDAYPAKKNVVRGLDYLFVNASNYGPGTGVCFAKGGHETYSTGLTMMAIAASKSPGLVVAAPGLVNGWTYLQVLQACVDYFAWAQNPDGGWIYTPSWPPSDNSNTGYAVLGLRYAEAPAYGFSCAIPATVEAGLQNWINIIQDPVSGGSYYTPPPFAGWVNLLKTGNLLFEMSFVGDTAATPRVQNAIAYIQNTWLDPSVDPGWRPHHYQAMYCLMKGFASLGIDSITVGGSPVDWYAEFATAIVGSQNPDGSWPGDYWAGDTLSTSWALLVLEKVAPPPPVEVKVTAPECACDLSGYKVSVAFSVERVKVDGSLKIYEDGTLVDTLELKGFTGDGSYIRTNLTDSPGLHVWLVVLDAVPSGGGGTPAHAEGKALVKVCETPIVAGIPDQIAPFQPFDLDDFLKYGGGLPVSWWVGGLPPGWTVVMDAGNVVTVTAPPWASDPADITFIATVSCCDKVICSSKDTARFTPNRPPDCSKAVPSVAILWPPNNKFEPVEILGVTDPDGDPITITINGILQDEPVNTLGDGNFAPDGNGVGTSTALLRSERSGTKKVPGNGRVYHVLATASDGRGGTCSCEVRVGVPHDVKDVPVDDGPKYDSTALAP